MLFPSRCGAQRWALLFTVFVGQFCALYAQSERGTITGVVKDSTGAVVPAAKITVTNPQTNVTLGAVTNQVGEYTVPSVQPGVYTLRVEKENFRPTETKGISVDAATTVRADVNLLSVGTSTQAVEVRASAISLPEPKTQTTASRWRTSWSTTLRLEVNGTRRTPFDLASLTPDAKNLGGLSGFSVGGGQMASYGTSLDGVSTNTSRAQTTTRRRIQRAVHIEAIDQFTVDTNGYKAEYGHAGGGLLTFASKSGTNNYSRLCLRVPSQQRPGCQQLVQQPRSGIPISIYEQNDFGVTAGGLHFTFRSSFTARTGVLLLLLV